MDPTTCYDLLALTSHDIQAVGISQDRTTLCRVTIQKSQARGAITDTGVNVCMDPYTDALIDVHAITPVPLGLAVEAENETEVLYCK